jgi:hypothetical protein
VFVSVSEDQLARQVQLLSSREGCSSSGLPRAMAMQSPICALSMALLENDLETLCGVPGVGRKTAARLLIELKSQLKVYVLVVEYDVSASCEGSQVLCRCCDGAHGRAEATTGVLPRASSQERADIW